MHKPFIMLVAIITACALYPLAPQSAFAQSTDGPIWHRVAQGTDPGPVILKETHDGAVAHGTVIGALLPPSPPQAAHASFLPLIGALIPALVGHAGGGAAAWSSLAPPPAPLPPAGCPLQQR